jgi:D-alanyl-D-alanine carboxypeptidase
MQKLGPTWSSHVRQARSIFLAIGFVFAILISTSGAEAARYASIVVDADTGEVLRSRSADTQNYPASLTKLMTLYLAFEALDDGHLKLNQRIPISKRAAGQAPSKLGIPAGGSISVQDALHALVVKSANDIATAMAEKLGGTETKFAAIMTRKARQLGMTRTTFRNASGLPNRRQLSTARDMSKLALAFLRNFPHHYHYFSRASFKFNGRTYRTHNGLLGKYRGLDGMKTGYIRASGFNLVASAKQNGRRVIGVVFGGKSARSRNAHMAKLLDIGFKRVAALDKERGRVGIAQIPKPRFKPGPTAVASVQPDGPWGIQVGAYSSVTAAQIAIKRATIKLPAMLDEAIAALTPVESKQGNTLYRARFFGLFKNDANAACRVLRRSTIPCVIVRNPEYLINLARLEN